MPDNKSLKENAALQKRHWVRVTRACNNNCLFCLDRENQNGAVLSLAEIVFELKKGLKGGARRVVISGGDPTVHPQLIDIVKKAKDLGYEHVQIITNGRMLAYEKFAIDLKNAGLDEVTLSLHSHIEKDFEEMTGVKGSYKQALAGLVNAQRQGFIVSVDIVINKINFKKLKETLKFYIKLGVSEFDLLYPVPFGSAWENKDKLFFSPEKAKKYLTDALSLSKNKNLFIWTNRMPAKYLEGFEDLIQNPIKIFDEVAGMRSELMSLVESGNRMSCEGERCSYCFMQDYCRDLDELLKNKKINAKKPPFCLRSGLMEKRKRLFFKFDENFTLEKFTDFHIRHRYFVKSSRCKECKHDAVCQGVWIEEIRKDGFSILKPRAQS